MGDATMQLTGENGSTRGRTLRFVLVLAVALGIVALSTWMVGPRPKAPDTGFPDDPPPLAVPSGMEKTPLGRSAALLATGDLGGARAGFTDIVAADPDGVAGQVGLVLSRWRSTGPESVERDLNQLTLEYPESALAALHLGLVQTLLNQDREARVTLRNTIELGRTAQDATSLRMARLADDLLHPTAFGGVFPVLVQADDVADGDRPALRKLLAAVTADDLAAAAKVAGTLDRSNDAMARVAATAARFDKDDPDATVARLEAIAALPATPRPAADRARFLAALAELWGHGRKVADRGDGCAKLQPSTAAGIDPRTRRLAVPIEAELCSKVPSMHSPAPAG
jgi:hypothetical protein